MTGKSRAAQRREKHKQQRQPTTQPAQPTPSSSHSAAHSNQSRVRAAAYDSSDDDDDELFGDAALANAQSLERAAVRDFAAEARQQNASRSSKRARAELAQQEADALRTSSRAAKAQKIVWRKFERDNRAFERFYQELLQLPADEWARFVASLKQPMPVHVRVNGACGVEWGLEGGRMGG